MDQMRPGSKHTARTRTIIFEMSAPNGYLVTDLVLYAAGEGQDDVYLSPVILPSSGVLQLTHTVGFNPSDALIIGITERDRDDKWDIVFFTTNAFVVCW